MTDAGTSTTEPTWVRRAGRLLVATTLFVLAGYLGRATVIDGEGLSLIWPAIGVAGLWIGSGDRASWPTDVAALSVATLTVNLTTGAVLEVAVVFLVTNLIQIFAFVALVRRWSPGLWGLGGTEALGRVSDLGWVVLAACLSGLAGLVVGAYGLVSTIGLPDPGSLAVWWGRNSVALIVITVLGILIGQPLAAAGSVRAAVATAAEALRPETAVRFAETVGLIGVSAALSLLIFDDSTAQPLAFLLLATSVWAGLRFASVAVTVHGILMGVVGVAFTLAGDGPFAAIDSVYARALVVQSFFAMSVLTGLALAFSRAEQRAAECALVTARRAADDRARLLDTVLQSLKEGIVVVEEGGRVLAHNSASRELAGLVDGVPEHVRSSAEYGLFHGNGEPIREEEMANVRALAGETVAPFDVHVRAPSLPQGRILEVSGQPLRSNDPAAPRRAMVNVRDVTLDRQHRDALASFAGVVAHDLFNPLSIVDGWTEALADEFGRGPVSPAVGALMVARIQDAATHMREFIADLLSYTVARDQTLRQGPVDLTAMVRSLAGLRTEGPSAPVIAVGDGLQVWADAGLMRQLLDNLIGNAVKYVVPGTRPVVEVTGEVHDGWLEVRVSDNGIGIPEPQREAVFETFHQVHGDQYGGTGLGLAICRRIVDRHGGTIHVAPGPHGVGSSLVFRLPRVPAPAGVPVPTQEART